MPPYEKLLAWQAAHELALAVYRQSATWPAEEQFGLVAQVRRSAFSAASNIVEGSAKPSRKDFGRFLGISLGSLSETQYAIRFARDLGYVDPDTWDRLDAQVRRAGGLTYRLRQRVVGKGDSALGTRHSASG